MQKRIKPKPGQESVWDYPRPPRVEDSIDHIQVVCNGVTLADTHRAKRILETSHPPVYYIPPEDIKMECLLPGPRTTFCEFKGQASYYTISVNGKTIHNGAWYYSDPSKGFESIANFVAFYPSKMDACFVNGEQVQAQHSDFYGGWITSRVVGPFKGGAGTQGW
jgi:uncharacterized protein (DUF427 family)